MREAKFFNIAATLPWLINGRVLKRTYLPDGQVDLANRLVPLLKLESDPAFFSRFEREEEIGRALDHPGILKILPVDPKERSRPYLVMEYLEGQTLDEVMQGVKPMPEADALRIVLRVCDALEYLLRDETTSVLALYVESLRRPAVVGTRG